MRLTGLVLVAALAQGAASGPTPAQIRAGIGTFVGAIFERHPDPYRYQARAEWDARVAALQARAGELDEATLFTELTRLTGALRDGHSYVWIDDESPLFGRAVPLLFWRFEDGLRVRAATPEQARWLGARVLAIGGVPIDEAWPRIVAARPGENEWMAESSAQVLVRIPQYLRTLGLAPSDGEARFALELDGERHDVVLSALDEQNLSTVWLGSLGLRTPPGWVEPPGVARARWLAHRAEPYWCEAIAEEHAVYLQLNQAVRDPGGGAPGFVAVLDRALQLVEESAAEKLVIDLRHNGGGDSSLWQPLVERIRRRPEIDRAGRLLVLVGRQMQSASVAWAARLESETLALFAGEPVASRPNFFNDPAGRNRETFHVPGSPINFRVSRRRELWSAPHDERRTIFPDLATPLSYADFAAGVDAALEAALAFDPEEGARCFRTEDGKDVLEPRWAHFLRASQEPAWRVEPR